jgi:hypothetical protein
MRKVQIPKIINYRTIEKQLGGIRWQDEFMQEPQKDLKITTEREESLERPLKYRNVSVRSNCSRSEQEGR